MRGAFICIEGLDGAGKNTQAELLKEKLIGKGIATSIFSYPNYESRYGEIISDFLEKRIDMDIEELFLLFLLDKEYDKHRIREEIKNGHVVITDRYIISTIAYQSAGGYDYESAKGMIRMLSLPEPDIVFYLDIPVEASMERKMKQKGSADRFEGARAYLEKVRNGYDRLFNERYGAKKWVKINGLNAVNGVHEIIFLNTEEFLK